MPAKPSIRPGIRNLPVQSITRALLGMETAMREPTSVMRPSRTMTMASGKSFAEWPQSVTSTTVPPASASGTEGADLGANGRALGPGRMEQPEAIPTAPRKRRREESHKKKRSFEDCRTADRAEEGCHTVKRQSL